MLCNVVSQLLTICGYQLGGHLMINFGLFIFTDRMMFSSKLILILMGVDPGLFRERGEGGVVMASTLGLQSQCAVQENIHTLPTEGIGISWGWGSLRPKI